MQCYFELITSEGFEPPVGVYSLPQQPSNIAVSHLVQTWTCQAISCNW